MAKAKNKKYNYILVMTSTGPVFATGYGTERHTLEWERDKPPMEFGRDTDDIVIGLRVNGYNAVSVVQSFEYDSQPFYYSMGGFQWVDKNE